MESLLSDEIILERSKIWSNVMAKFCEEETYKEIDFREIQSHSEENSDDTTPNQTVTGTNNDENNQEERIENVCTAIVKVDDYEGETSADDFIDCLNQTFSTMKQNEKKWEKWGMMKVLETFDLDQISKIVVPWVEKNKLDKSVHSTSVDEHIVHIEEHHHRQVHMASDDDSLHSLDTANYIRSSRKKKRSSCTTTTIKKYSFVKGSKKHLREKYGVNGLNLRKVIEESEKCLARSAMEEFAKFKKRNSFHSTPPSRFRPIEYEAKSVPMGKRRSRTLKRRSDVSKRSVSSSSSSATSSPISKASRKLKRKSRPQGETLNRSRKNVELTDNETSESDEESPPKRSFIPPTKPLAEPAKPIAPSTSSNNETGFLGASIINSTALSHINHPSEPNPTRKCLLTPIKNKPEPQPATQLQQPGRKMPRVRLFRVKTKSTSANTIEPDAEKEQAEPEPTAEVIETTQTIEDKQREETNILKDNNKILLFCPTNLEPHKKNLSGKRFYLTQDYFSQTVGKRNSHRFIKLNAKKFPLVFSCMSRIYFEVPKLSAESASSDEDILYIFGRAGKIIEETYKERNTDPL